MCIRDSHDRHLRADLLELVLVTAAVDCHHHQLCDVGTRTEELHVLADTHRRYAARDSVIIAVVRAVSYTHLVGTARSPFTQTD